jgi:hypothetical protein
MMLRLYNARPEPARPEEEGEDHFARTIVAALVVLAFGLAFLIVWAAGG